MTFCKNVTLLFLLAFFSASGLASAVRTYSVTPAPGSSIAQNGYRASVVGVLEDKLTINLYAQNGTFNADGRAFIVQGSNTSTAAKDGVAYSAGEQFAGKLEFNVNNLALGTYTYHIRRNTAENGWDNNVWVGPITLTVSNVTAPIANLVPKNYSINKNVFFPREKIDIYLDIKNEGNLYAPGGQVYLYLNETVDLSIQHLENEAYPNNINPGVTDLNEGEDFRVPHTVLPGSYKAYAWLDATNTANESNEGDNVVSFSVTVRYPNIPLTNVVCDKTIVTKGESVTLNYTVNSEATYNVLLGASLQSKTTGQRYDFSYNSARASLIQGVGNYPIVKKIPNNIPVGEYVVRAAIWHDFDDNGRIDSQIDKLITNPVNFTQTIRVVEQQPLPAPQNLQLTANGNSITATWQKPSNFEDIKDHIEDIVIYAKRLDTDEALLPVTLPKDATTHTYIALATNTTYQIAVNYIAKANDAEYLDGGVVGQATTQNFVTPEPEYSARHRGNPSSNGYPSILWKGVDVTDGNYHFSELDYHRPAYTMPFSLVRYYNSKVYDADASFFPGGGQWKTNFHQWIREYVEGGNRICKILREDGSIDTFIEQADGSYKTIDLGNRDQLVKLNGEFVLVPLNGYIHYYDTQGVAKPGEELHLLTRIQDRLDVPNKMTIVWNAANQITSVVDVCGQTHTFAYTGNKLTSVTDYTGATITYTHAVTQPQSDMRFYSVKDHRNKISYYHYEADSVYNRLNKVYDKRGFKVVELTYDSNERVFSQKDANGRITEYTYENRYEANDWTIVKTPDRTRSHAFKIQDLMVQEVRNASTESNPNDVGDVGQRSMKMGRTSNSSNRGNNGLNAGGEDWEGNTHEIARNPNNGDITQWTRKLQDGTQGKPVSYGYQARNFDVTSIEKVNLSLPTYTHQQVGDRKTSYGYSDIGQLKNYTQPAHNTGDVDDLKTKLTHDDKGRIETVTDVRGNVWTYEYGSLTANRGMVSKITDPFGKSIIYNYSNKGWLSSFTNKRNVTTSFARDENGNKKSQVVEISAGVYIITFINYDENGWFKDRLEPIGFASGNSAIQFYWRTEVERDPVGNVIKLHQPHDANTRKTTEFVYNEMDEVKTVKNASQHPTDYNINKFGFMETTEAPMDNVINYDHDKNGNVTGFTSILDTGRTITNYTGYDTENRPIWRKWNRFGETQGVKTVYDDANRTVTRYTVNEDPATFDTANPALLVESETKDKNGRLSSFTRSGDTVTLEYDDNVVSFNDGFATHEKVSQVRIYPLKGAIVPLASLQTSRIVLTYNALGHHIATEQQRGVNGIYARVAIEIISRDENGNPIETIRNDGTRHIQSFDALDRRTQLIIRKNGTTEQTINYEYDKSSRIIKITHIRNGASEVYDLEYNHANQPTKLTNPAGQSLSLGYNTLGQVTSLTYPGNKTVAYSYDDADRLQTLTDWLGQNVGYEYFTNGLLKKTTNPNGMITDRDYDSSGVLKLLETFTPDGSVLGKTSINYRNARGLLEKADNTSALTRQYPLGDIALDLVSDQSNTYSAHSSGHTTLNTSGSDTYSFDSKLGNLTSILGNQKQQSFVWNLANQLIETNRSANGVTVNETYDYNVFWLRRSKSTTSIGGDDEDGSVEYFWNPFASLAQLLVENHKDSQGNLKHTAYNIYSPQGISHRITEGSNNSTTTHFYHSDEINNIFALSDQTGKVTDFYRYSLFGTSGHEGSSKQPFTFVGNLGVQQDTLSGLHYMRARYYHQDSRRFISLDPLLGDPTKPQSLNRYHYAGNNPYKYHDASGLMSVPNDFRSYMSKAWKALKTQSVSTVSKIYDVVSEKILELKNIDKEEKIFLSKTILDEPSVNMYNNYLEGGGNMTLKSVDARDIFWNAQKTQNILRRFEQQTLDSSKDNDFLINNQFDNSYEYEHIVFALGKTNISGSFYGVNSSFGLCGISMIDLKDEFTDPYDLFDWFEGEYNPDGVPYEINSSYNYFKCMSK